jgi:hypothetical protein
MNTVSLNLIASSLTLAFHLWNSGIRPADFLSN